MIRKKIRKTRNIISAQREDFANAVVFAVIFLFLLSYFKPNLILLNTTTSGGDTGSHNYPLWYLKYHLLPRGRLSGWSPGWYAGFPIFQFYFVLPFLLMALLSYVIPLWTSFKVVTVLGTFLLPVAVFAAMRLVKFKFPLPIIAALLALPFLFMEGNSMWGGNIPSTLAGEFAYSLSLAFAVLFTGMLYRSVEARQKSRTHILLCALVFSLVVLCHIYIAIFAAVTSIFFLLSARKNEFVERFCHLFKIYGLAFLISAFWTVPLLAKVGYATPYHYVWNLKSVKEVFPDILIPFILLSFGGVYIGLKNLDNRIFYLMFAVLAAFILYKTGPVFGLTDIRFIPMVQLFPMLIAAYCICETRIIKEARSKFIPLLVLAIIVVIWVGYNTTYIDFWIKWNYEGFQSKQYWNQLENIMTYLRELPAGRVVHEYSNSHDKFGTPRTFENIPLFSGKPTLEGLNIESGLSAPHVFVIQAEISTTSTCPIPGLRCGAFNITKAERHLEIFNIRYIVATTPKLKNAIASSTDWELLSAFDEISIYDVGNTDYVEVAKYKPAVFEKRGDNWKDLSLVWFRDSDYLDVPIIFTADADDLEYSNLGPRITSVDEITRAPIDSDCEIFSEEITDDEIRIRTNCIGVPLLVKVSYFPNWHVEGADKVYLASPSFMMVFPEQEDVRLYYGYTFSDHLGFALSLVGVSITALLLVFRNVRVFRKIKP